MDGKKIIESIGHCVGTEDEWKNLVDFYNGNPFALELAAGYILTSYKGDISLFLRKDSHIFGRIKELLDWHFQRLSEKEKQIMYWLAINREPVSTTELIYDIFPLVKEIDDDNQYQIAKDKHLDEINETIRGLQQRIPLEKSAKNDSYGLQPVLIEYVIQRLVEEICQEIKTGEFTESSKLNCYALVKVNTKAYILEEQKRTILSPMRYELTQNL